MKAMNMADTTTRKSIHPATRMGTVSLTVANLDRQVEFYTKLLGFTLHGRKEGKAVLGAGAVSAGGYHHVGLNSWIGHGRPPAPEGFRGLRHFTITVPDRASLDEVAQRVTAENVDVQEREGGLIFRDPSHNGIVIKHS